MRGVLLITSCVVASLVVVSQAASLKQRNMVLKAGVECSGRDGDPFPNPEECGSFLQCEPSGVAAVKQCPPGLHFNAELKVCDYPHNAHCSVSSSSSSSSESEGDSLSVSSSSEEGDDKDSSSEERVYAKRRAAKVKSQGKSDSLLKNPNVTVSHA